MQSFPDKKAPSVVILRHRRENLKKCSLRGLESKSDFQFLTYPKCELPSLEGYILLSLDGRPLSKDDAGRGLLILDGTWRYAEKMEKYVLSRQNFIFRSIPREWKTAYPRKQDDCPLPDQGLASVEAIFAAYHILGQDTTGILDHYYWKDEFLQVNKDLISSHLS